MVISIIQTSPKVMGCPAQLEGMKARKQTRYSGPEEGRDFM